MVQGLKLGLGMVKGLNWGLRLEGLGQNLFKCGTGTGYGQGDFSRSRIRPSELVYQADHIYTLKTWLDNDLLIIGDNVPDTSGMMV